jgi:hypothetical protein
MAYNKWKTEYKNLVSAVKSAKNNEEVVLCLLKSAEEISEYYM